MARELQLAGMFLHQLLETAERHDFTERSMHSVSPGPGTKSFRSFINELSIKFYRCFCSHIRT